MNNNNNVWKPDETINRQIHTNEQITSNWKYRQYMQKNANEIMKYNTMQSFNNNPYTLLNAGPVDKIPFLYETIYETSKPKHNMETSDLKHDYISKTQMKSRMISPSITTDIYSFISSNFA